MTPPQGKRVIEVEKCDDCPFSHETWEDDGYYSLDGCFLDENVRIGGHGKPLVKGAPCPLVQGPVVVKSAAKKEGWRIFCPYIPLRVSDLDGNSYCVGPAGERLTDAQVNADIERQFQEFLLAKEV